VVKGTSEKQLRAWKRFQSYLQPIGIINDPYLEGFDRGQQHKIICAFGQYIRESGFSGKPTKLLKSESVRSAMDCVAQAFKLAAHTDPRLDINGKFAFILQRQLRGYRSTDPGEKPQVSITGSVLQQFYKLTVSSFDTALCQLFIGAFFFAMRSCEYVKVQGPRKTKLLTVKNIRFYIGNRLINHLDPNLSSAECVSITFEFQKRDTRNDVITQHRSGDNVLCPVRTWAAIIKRLASYPGASPTDTVNLFRFPDGKKHMFSGSEF